MFGTSKPTASLSSGLLARKGQARPAMRPQGFHGPAVSLEDLGWNDMGDEPAPSAPVIAISPAAAPIAPPIAIVPPVLVERETLREEIEEPVAVAPLPVNEAPAVEAPAVEAPAVEAPAVEAPALITAAFEVAAPVAVPEPVSVPAAAVERIGRDIDAAKSKAAFTLRLDADRHLRLRLASASRNRSAQALVVDALDQFLASLPEVEGLVSQLSTDPTSRGK